MEASRSSETAKGVALIRAFHQLVDGEPKVLNDPIAARLLHPAAIDWMCKHQVEHQSPHASALRSHIVTRSRVSEDALEKACAAGVRQYVILGAGLDTFAYRLPSWVATLSVNGGAPLRIFEVDHPASQADKQARLKTAGITPPANLIWSPIDFEASLLSQGLAAAGFDRTQPAFFSCLGVLMYLTADATHALFDYIGSLPPGTAVAFTFAEGLGPNAQDGLKKLAAKVAAVGEPFRSQLGEDELWPMLCGRGFAELDVPRPEQLEARYFHGRTDGLPAPTQARIAIART